MVDILKLINLRRTPQSLRADARQQPNAAGGFTFVLDDVARLRRFLILGTEGGTYYTSAPELTVDNAEVVLRLCAEDPDSLLATIREVSVGGLAPRQQPTLFALAAATARCDEPYRRRAVAMLPEIARTGTQLFLFAGYVEQFRGWGRGLRRAVAAWYADQPLQKVAYQAVKYRSREGWTHRDLLRLSHPRTTDPARRALFEWVVRGGEPTEVAHALPQVTGFVAAQRADTDELVRLIDRHALTWEMLPDHALTQPQVWDSLVRKGMPMTALLRQLGRLTALGVLAPGAEVTDLVVAQLVDTERIRSARVHPLQVLIAQRTYATGHGLRGSLTWRPVPQVIDALEQMFERAFTTIRPTGKRLLLAIDVSASMDCGHLAGSAITPREAAAAMAMVTARTESAYQMVGFSHRLVPLPISPRQRMDHVVTAMRSVRMGATDCALPMQFALRRKLAVDAFVVFTDNETWFGDEHPHQALQRYRAATGIPARLVVVGMTGTLSTIADPDDAGMLDVVGFDASAPSVMADFIRG
ncbi:TROVE domain-containing protein [Naumannella sp. ID2617S]|nr:TROVE domain-containing protein [Naumannella sp. ID2617S]